MKWTCEAGSMFFGGHHSIVSSTFLLSFLCAEWRTAIIGALMATKARKTSSASVRHSLVGVGIGARSDLANEAVFNEV